MADNFQIAVAGAGLMGQRHVAAIEAVDDIDLIALVDPSDAGKAFAAKSGVSSFDSLQDLFAAETPDGVILATPNHLHVEHGFSCVAAGVPFLVEKPIGVDVLSALALIEAAEAASVPVLVGHHRRHNPIIKAAKDAIDGGAIGRTTTVHGSCWLYKPDDYFEVDWRREAGAGPIYINLIHDIDLLRVLCGEIVSVSAFEANAVRSFAVEDSAAIILRFENGALGALSVSDCVVAPWSWEMTARENPAYPATDEACYLIGGTHGSLEIPSLNLWQQPVKRGWWEEITSTKIEHGASDPLINQIRHFSDVARGFCEPLVSGRDGLQTLAVIEALKQSAANPDGRAVSPVNVMQG